LIDIILIATILLLSYWAYQNRFYIKLFEYFKIFILITIAAKLSTPMAIFLQRIHFLHADSYAIAIFIAFIMNLIILFSSYQLILKFLNNFINSQSIKTFFAKLITLFEITIICTFSLFLMMQITVIKRYVSQPLAKTISYPYIKTFYTQFLNDDFIYALLHTDTKTNHKELIFKSFKNSF
jgi:hypothetical protein